MNRRQVDIYKNLFYADHTQYRDSLSLDYDVSIRTIQNDIKELNSKLLSIGCAPITVGRDNSLSISSKKCDILHLYASISLLDYAFETRERHCILIIILLLNNSYATLNSISDFLGYSKTTLTNDFTELKELLGKKNISIQSKKFRGIYIEKSDEISVRRLIINLVLEHTWLIEFIIKKLINTKLIDQRLKFMLEDYQFFSEIINKVEKNSGFFLTKDSKQKVILCTKLSMSRMMLGHLVMDQNSNPENDYIAPNNLPMTRAISEEIRKHSNKFLLDDNYEWLDKLLLQMEYIELAQLPINYQIFKLHLSIKVFLHELSNDLNCDLRSDFLLYQGISDYLHQSLDTDFGKIVDRSHNAIVTELDNNQLKSIVSSVSENAEIIELLSGVRLKETQISELTYFVQASILRTENNINNLTYVLISDNGKGVISYIHEQLKDWLNTSRIDKIISPLLDEYLENNNPNLIITTEVIMERDIPMVHISQKLTNQDKELIDGTIRMIKSNISNKKSKRYRDSKSFNKAKQIILSQQPYGKGKKQSKFIDDTSPFSYLLPKRNIISDAEVKDWREAVTKTSNILLEDGVTSIGSVKDIISKLENDSDYILINNSLAIIPLFNTKEHFQNKFSMSLMELKDRVDFIGDNCHARVKYVSCVTIEKKRLYLKGIHFLANMLEKDKL